MKIVFGLSVVVVAVLLICWPATMPIPEASRVTVHSTPAIADQVKASAIHHEYGFPEPSMAESPQERRLLAFLANTRDQGFDELVDALKVNNDAYGMLLAQGFSGGFSPPAMLKMAMADRRIWKLYELLQGMAPDQASDRVAAAFDSEFASYCRRWEGTGFKAGAFPERKYALTGLLLLCSEFCDESIVLELIDDWQDWHTQNLDKGAPRRPGVSEFLFCNQGGPEPLMVCNLYMNGLLKKGIQIDELNVELAAMGRDTGFTGFPELVYRNIHPWHLYNYELFREPENVLAVIPIFETWSPADDMYYPGVKQDLVLTELRSWVDAEIQRKP